MSDHERVLMKKAEKAVKGILNSYYGTMTNPAACQMWSRRHGLEAIIAINDSLKGISWLGRNSKELVFSHINVRRLLIYFEQEYAALLGLPSKGSLLSLNHDGDNRSDTYVIQSIAAMKLGSPHASWHSIVDAENEDLV